MSVLIKEISSNQSENIQNEHPSSEYNFKRKSQDKISPSNQGFEQPEDELIEFKVEQQMNPYRISSEHIENKMVTLTSETLSYEYCFGTKLQDKFNKYYQIFKQPE